MKSLLLVLAMGLSLTQSSAADFFVAPTGGDQNAGTANAPFATLPRARSAVRELIAAGLQTNVTVWLRDGRYELSETFVFGPQDSGTEKFSITYAAYPGERVIVSGGRQITGWTKGEGNVWMTTIPEVATGKWYFKQLFVDDQRATRARSPNADDKEPYFRLLDSTISNNVWTVTCPHSVVSDWKNVSDVELVVLGIWEITRKRLQSADASSATVTLAPPHFRGHPNIQPRAGMSAYFENARAMLDRPGEWYLNRETGVLSYWPLSKQDMTQVEVIAPVLQTLLEVAGTPQRPVRNVHFKGIHFSNTAWELPQAGYIGVQACFYPPRDYGETGSSLARIGEGIRFTFADSCSIEDGQIAHFGGAAIGLRKGCSNNLIQGNRVFDIGGNGIMVGEGADPTKAADAVRGNRVANNFVQNCGTVFRGAVGIWAGFTDGTIISHNLVRDLPYTAISVGWEWGDKPTGCKNNIVEFNHVDQVVGLLSDGGGIYTLGFQLGTVLRDNLVQRVLRGPGIYLDAGSKGFVVENNVMLKAGNSIKMDPLRDHPDWVAFRGNIFGNDMFLKDDLGYALSFANDYSMDVPHEAPLEPAQMTVEAWVMMKAQPTGNDPSTWILSKNANELTDGHYALLISRRDVGAYLNIGGGRENCYAAWSSDHPLSTNEWHHIAMTYDGSNLKAYCDGKLAGSCPVNRPRTTGNGLLRIGKRADGFNPSFNGFIREIRFYNCALSDAELKSHYDSPATLEPKTQRNLAARWNFGEMHAAMEKIIANAGPVEPYRTRFNPVTKSGDARPTAKPAEKTSPGVAR